MSYELHDGTTDTFDCICKWCGKVLHVEQGKLQPHRCLIEFEAF